jgi:CBS domain-containing protein
MAEGFNPARDDAPAVRTIMERGPVSVTPDTQTLDAIDLMRQHNVTCLPVVVEGKLVGIVSESDFMSIAYKMLANQLGTERDR